MSFVRACVYDKNQEREARTGDGMLMNLRPVTVATAGNLTITLPQILGGCARFTGAAGAVTYTTPTAVDIIAAMPNMDIGDTFSFILSNTAAQTATIAGGTDVTAGGTLTVNAAFRIFVLEKTSATTMTITGL